VHRGQAELLTSQVLVVVLQKPTPHVAKFKAHAPAPAEQGGQVPAGAVQETLKTAGDGKEQGVVPGPDGF